MENALRMGEKGETEEKTDYEQFNLIQKLLLLR